MNKKGLFPDTVIGFRANLSTEDIKLRISEEVLNQVHRRRTRAILALDFTKAFDKVKHVSIMSALSNLNVGEKTHKYITAFLSEQRADLQLGSIKSDIVDIGSRGNAQGSVLSPFLINITLIHMTKRLEKIPDLRYSMYADDINLWATTGSEGHIDETLQAAADVVTECAGVIGLSCSLQKSELLVIRSPYVRKTPQPDTIVLVDDVPLPEVQTLRVLGMHIPKNARSTVTINKLIGCVSQTNRLIMRIANKHMAMKETDLRRLIKAFVRSRIVYSLPYLHLQYAEREKVEGLIRQSYKCTLHILRYTATEQF